MQKFRKGDVVSVQGVVEFDHDGSDELLFIRIKGHHNSVAVTPDQWSGVSLKLVHPHLEVGDSVCWDEHGRGIIHAINNGHAWIGMESGDYCTRLLTAIERAEPADA